MFCKWLNSSIWPKGGSVIGTTRPSQRGPGSNVNEEVVYILQSSKTGASPSDIV